MGDKIRRRFEVLLSPHFILFTTFFSAALAFVGGWARRILVEQHAALSEANNADSGGNGAKPLPEPVLLEGKTMLETKYTYYLFDVKAVRTTHNLHIRQPETFRGQAECFGEHVREKDVSFQGNVNAAHLVGEAAAESPLGYTSTSYAEKDEHLPAGQHLLVDIKNVDAYFLNSTDRLSQALIDVVEDSELTLLSYHCHSLLPADVSCIGLLPESHISFHTWPEEGVITLDWFTSGSEPLVPAVSIIENSFAIPREGVGIDNSPHEENATVEDYGYNGMYVDPPRMQWSHVQRGFRPPDMKERALAKDLYSYVLKPLQFDYKKEIVSTQTEFQRIDIYDIIHPRFNSIQAYERSLRTNVNTYESHHPNLYSPNRLLFVDGMMQSSSDGDEACHEALVHPAMFVHEWPERVAIMGGGEGATLREVLKHDSVRHVKMIEIDDVMIQLSRDHLAEWSDCSDLVGSAESCFDDARVEVLHEDALRWFTDRFRYPSDCEHGKEDETCSECSEMRESSKTKGNHDKDFLGEGEDTSDEKVECFDVIIMDAVNPEHKMGFSTTVHRADIIESVYVALCENGVLAMRLGESPKSNDSHRHWSRMSIFEEVGFQSIHVYEESHGGFHSPLSFVVACKSYSCRYSWYSSEPQMEVLMRQSTRLRKTHSGRLPLKYFDSATMRSYQVPPKAWETVFCQSQPTTPASCRLRGYNPYIVNYSIDKFEVKMSSLGERAGRGMFAKVDVPLGSYIAQEQAHTKLHFDQWAITVMERLAEKAEDDIAKDIADVLSYVYGYGFQHSIVADLEYYVDSGALTFVNHGCNGTSNMDMLQRPPNADDRLYSEHTYDPERHGLLNPVHVESTFDPAIARHLPHVTASFHVAKHDLKEGEEIFVNYMLYHTDQDEWEDAVLDLRAQCQGKVLGEVKQYEEDHSEMA